MNKLGNIILGFLLFCLTNNTSGQTISGMVISEFSEPLAGASIWIPHTNIGTVTDNKGNYSITIDSIYNTLRYCFVGFECQEITINNDTIVNIILQQTPIVLEDIIIKEIGPVRKRQYTQSVPIIKRRRKGLFRKEEYLIYGNTDSTLIHLETERVSNLEDSINTYIRPYLRDSKNFTRGRFPEENILRKYIADSINYPEAARKKEIQGYVFVKFTINEESKISDIIILRGIHPLLDDEVISILQMMPNEIQAEFGKYIKLNNRQIPRKYKIKIGFQLIPIE